MSHHDRRYGRYPDQAAFDAAVKDLYDRNRDDLRISISTGMSRKAVYNSRHRQGLAPLYGPAGRPTPALRQLQVAA